MIAWLVYCGYEAATSKRARLSSRPLHVFTASHSRRGVSLVYALYVFYAWWVHFPKSGQGPHCHGHQLHGDETEPYVLPWGGFVMSHAAPEGYPMIHQCHAWSCLPQCEMLAVMYLQRGPPITENESTTHRTHRTHRLCSHTSLCSLILFVFSKGRDVTLQPGLQHEPSLFKMIFKFDPWAMWTPVRQQSLSTACCNARACEILVHWWNIHGC